MHVQKKSSFFFILFIKKKTGFFKIYYRYIFSFARYIPEILRKKKLGHITSLAVRSSLSDVRNWMGSGIRLYCHRFRTNFDAPFFFFYFFPLRRLDEAGTENCGTFSRMKSLFHRVSSLMHLHFNESRCVFNIVQRLWGIMEISELFSKADFFFYYKLLNIYIYFFCERI